MAKKSRGSKVLDTTKPSGFRGGPRKAINAKQPKAPDVDAKLLHKARKALPGMKGDSLKHVVSHIETLSAHFLSNVVGPLAARRLKLPAGKVWVDADSFQEAVCGSVLQLLAENADSLQREVGASEFVDASLTDRCHVDAWGIRCLRLHG